MNDKDAHLRSKAVGAVGSGVLVYMSFTTVDMTRVHQAVDCILMRYDCSTFADGQHCGAGGFQIPARHGICMNLITKWYQAKPYMITEMARQYAHVCQLYCLILSLVPSTKEVICTLENHSPFLTPVHISLNLRGAVTECIVQD